ncbi:MAG: hypothetical protein IKZ98_13540 [Clostridia bacterium]|nr:hypothetical protein [Clostridia bacterium]
MFNNQNEKTTILRLLAVLLAAVLMMGSAIAEGNDKVFAQFEGLSWSFCSGAGAWSTDLVIKPDGTFTGDFHDSDMGDIGEDYPNGIVYLAQFHGKMSITEQINEYSWKLRVDELVLDEEPGKEAFEDGCKYIFTDVYGLTKGDEMVLYKPDAPMKDFTDDMHFWAHSIDLTDLPFWFFYSEKNNSGFIGLRADPDTSVVNPWEDMTAEQLQKKIGIMFHAPEDAQNLVYHWNAGSELAEMKFTWKNGEYAFRSKPVALDMDGMEDISGLQIEWENAEPTNVAGFQAALVQAKSEAKDIVECVMWYDNTTGIMHSLSVTAPDVDGLDLAAVAENIVLPASR